MDAKKILLIEDEEFIRDLYQRQLNLAGIKTDAAENGKEGLALLGKNFYSLILLDIMLPSVNGLDILKQIKANEKTKDIPVVLLTNLGQDEIMKEGFRLGAKAYIVKALHTPDEIVKKIKEFLDGNFKPQNNRE
ncbi:response regulator [Candidatus Microgenomates bacterium]|nr:response regulator [Candidatus Microgenomates bacterium]